MTDRSKATTHAASMMPRHFTEEIFQGQQPRRRPGSASMMPRHFTEEILSKLQAVGGILWQLQ